jgi:5-methylcytosine-specific restriction endonuclease McrA
MTTGIDAIKSACQKISDGRLDSAKKIINEEYPFTSLKNKGRQYTEVKKTEVFIRDGFIDRYSGDKLVYPPVLKILSKLMPHEFPYQKHWKMSNTHIAWWELIPTIDHQIPVSRGGEDKKENWVCTSQLRNSAKSNWTLEELGWELHDSGDNKNWDGMMSWFMDYVSKNKHVLKDDPYIKKWYKAAEKYYPD